MCLVRVPPHLIGIIIKFKIGQFLIEFTLCLVHEYRQKITVPLLIWIGLQTLHLLKIK